MRDHDYSAASSFLAAVFGEMTEENVEIRALPNQTGAGAVRSLFTRDPGEIETHCATWDQLERAVYFGTATRLKGSSTGSRTDLAEMPSLWADVDTYKHDLNKEDVAVRMQGMAMPPTIGIDSGGGLQFYWLLREAINVRADAPDAADTEDEIVSALKRLADITCGDLGVCDLARIMRLPGTHNTKTGELRPVRVLWFSDARYEFDDLVEMLDWHRPVIVSPVNPDGRKEPQEADPFLAAAQRFGFKAPLDVEQRLAAMTYLNDDDSSVHQTQLHVSASLVTQGFDDDAIVEILIEATKHAVGIAGANWNWRREERNLRKMIATARTKFASEAPPPAAQPEPAKQGEDASRANGTTGGSRVIDLTREREARGKKDQKEQKKGKEPLISRIGKAVISGWQEARGPIAVVAGEPYTYAGGIWTIWDKSDHHALRAAIQAVVEAGGIDPKTQLLNAVYRYVLERPALVRQTVDWDASGLVICQDGAIDPLTRATCHHSPDHWATTRVEVRTADMGQGCPQWLHFLDTSFSDLSHNERGEVIATLQEWFGCALVKRKPRELRKALWLYGESRTGKSRVSEVLRLLIGEPTSALKIRSLEKNFGGSALLGKRAWIADDAVGPNDEVDDALFKVIVTGEAFSMDVKNQAHQTVRLNIPVLLTSNSLPRVRDQSDAVFNRSLLIHMRVVRSEEETAGIVPIDEIVARNELAGVFSWSLEGWARVAGRGRFNPPSAMREASDNFKAANNVVNSWAKESVKIDIEYMIDRRDAYGSFKGWFKSEFGETAKVPSAKFLIASLRQCVTLGADHKSIGVRYLTGIKLTEDGLIYRDESESFGEKVGSGCKKDEVNKPCPIVSRETAEAPSARRPPRF